MVSTFLSALLAAAVQVVLQLDAHLPLVGLVSDVGVLQQLIGGRPLRVVLHQTALDEAEELLRPCEAQQSESSALIFHPPQ